MRHEMLKQTKEGLLKVFLKLADDCKNGHEDFCLTGELWCNHSISTCGCIHETIIESFPELQLFADLHLSNFEGTPLSCIANGYYHMQRLDFSAMQSMLRCSLRDVEKLKKATDKEHFRYILNVLKLPDLWLSQAQKAIEYLERVTGAKFISKAKKIEVVKMTNEEMEEAKKKYTFEEIQKRKNEKISIKLKELENKKQEEFQELQKSIELLKLNFERTQTFKKFIIENDLSCNYFIFDGSSHIDFNWNNFDPVFTNYIDIVKELRKNKIFKNVKFTNKKKPIKE